jgi:hypothetical protein
LTHHEGHHGHEHEYPHPGGFKHHGECPYCKSGGTMSKEDEISALEKFKKEINDQLAFVNKRIGELQK